MESTPIRVQPHQWGEVVIEGSTVACKLHLRHGRVLILNNSMQSARFTVNWSRDMEEPNPKTELTFVLVPGGMIEFDDLEPDRSGFGPWVVLNHLQGGELELVHYPPEDGFC